MPDNPPQVRRPSLPRTTDWGPGASRLLDDYLAIANERGAMALERTALRTKSLAARQLLAWAATGGTADYHRLTALLAGTGADGGTDPSLPELDPSWTIALARVVGFQNLLPGDADLAVTLMSVVERRFGLEPFTSTYQKSYAELLYTTGRHDRLRTLLPRLTRLPAHTAQHLSTDLLNPHRAADSASDQEWLAAVNEIFTAAGLEPIGLAAEGATPFDRLRCTATDLVSEGPLVTVIMTAYRPGPAILTSVRSILDQSWRNLELVIVDDASPEQFQPVLDECVRLDDRVRLLRQDVNGGTYVARNAGLDAALGAIVTFQDSDDWSHPRRIERQVRPLLEDPAVVATRSLSVRVSEQLEFNRPGYEPTRPNASSLMFRRQQALNTIGYFDSIRKGADTEYHRRLTIGAPQSSVDIGEPLALVRMGDTSLSRAEFSFGWHHPARYAYQTVYGRWHRLIEKGERDPYVSRDPSHRPVPAPARFARGVPGRDDPSQQYDVVFLSEWRRYGGPQRSMIEEIQALTARGLRVGVAQLEAFRFMGQRTDPLCEAVLELIENRTVDLVQLDQGAEVSLLVIRYPPVLQFPPSIPTDIHVGQVIILANQAPSELDGSDVRYTVPACEQTVAELFGRSPVWVPQGPIVRQALVPLVDADRLADYDMPGILRLEEWATPRDRFRSDRPVIGRLSRDTAMKWPADRETMFDAYPVDDEFDVRVMGGRNTVLKVAELSRLPKNWIVFNHGEVPPRLFLFQLDFFVYFHHPLWQEAFGRAILEAIAAGCVTILPPHFRELFGDAAVYCEPSAVQDVVRSFYKDPERYREQVRRGYDFVRERFSHDSYADRIAGILAAARV